MIRKILILAMTMALCLTAFVSAACADTATMYVKTGDGGPLNIRSEPKRGDNLVGSYAYGAEVLVDQSFVGNEGWSAVIWGDSTAYVMSRFLVSAKPAPYVPSGSDDKKETETDTRAFSTVDQLNTLVTGAKIVEPYYIVVRPVRASGWVYLRWFPSKNAREIGTYGDGHQLRVIAELKDWYQVEDPESGKTGFLYKSYVR